MLAARTVHLAPRLAKLMARGRETSFKCRVLVLLRQRRFASEESLDGALRKNV